MKSLKMIRGFFQAGSIISLVIRIFCIIGIVGCVIGITGLTTLQELRWQGKNIEVIFAEQGSENLPTVITKLSFALVACITELVLCTMARRLFQNALSYQSPFRKELAGKMVRFGLTVIIVTVSVSIASAIAFNIVRLVVWEVARPELNFEGNVAIGIAFLLFALVFQYGAEVAEKNQLSDDQMK